jgi:hypothetical protein
MELVHVSMKNLRTKTAVHSKLKTQTEHVFINIDYAITNYHFHLQMYSGKHFFQHGTTRAYNKCTQNLEQLTTLINKQLTSYHRFNKHTKVLIQRTI